MNECAYIILGFLGGIVFSILFIITTLKSIVVKIGRVQNNSDDE